MKSIILFYSYTGNTKALALKMAKDENLDLEEIYELKKPLRPIGLYLAFRRKTTEIWPIKAPLTDYDRIIIMSPVWGGHPVPAINRLFSLLPSGKRVDLIMVSGGGGTKKSKKKTMELVNKRRCSVIEYTDVKVTRDNGDLTTTILS
ncbi:MAG TPA: hypothetical protein H9887_05630 [Candidatus Dorea intestinavium]|nr:hypothetical protein [Candidatus Dorea intestinavium]